jgi:hypothetical protein
LHKAAQGWTTRVGSYETLWWTFIGKNFPTTYKSFRSFDMCKGVFHVLRKYDMLDRFVHECSQDADFLLEGLQNEQVISAVSSVLNTMINNFATAWHLEDLQLATLELLRFTVPTQISLLKLNGNYCLFTTRARHV